MTKKQAYELAKQISLLDDLLPTKAAMEIFAGAFAEWSGNNYMLHANMWYKRELPTDESEIPKYTTPQLISEFEKIDNK